MINWEPSDQNNWAFHLNFCLIVNALYWGKLSSNLSLAYCYWRVKWIGLFDYVIGRSLENTWVLTLTGSAYKILLMHHSNHNSAELGLFNLFSWFLLVYFNISYKSIKDI